MAAMGVFQRKSVSIIKIIPLATFWALNIVVSNISLRVNTVGTYQVCAAGRLQTKPSPLQYTALHIVLYNAVGHSTVHTIHVSVGLHTIVRA
jgi:predicted transglutaminase-like protease